MTDDRMALIELVEKAADADLVREMLAFAAERIMDGTWPASHSMPVEIHREPMIVAAA